MRKAWANRLNRSDKTFARLGAVNTIILNSCTLVVTAERIAYQTPRPPAIACNPALRWQPFDAFGSATFAMFDPSFSGCDFNVASNQTHSETFYRAGRRAAGQHWTRTSAIAEVGTVFLRLMRISASKYGCFPR
jgi:hypothetical protein